ncbi:MAG: DegT/DnrJ/EryC1/StrS family aminotransferase, partial [Gemmatimonadetes bacterium]
DEVILPSHTFVATGSAVAMVGATPVFADVGEDHMIDPDHVASLVTERTRALLPVQLNGRTCAMDRLGAIAEQHGLLLFEDAAQGLGSAYRGRRAGSFGLAASFSFYPAKLLGCFGDGGAIVTDDQGLAARLRGLRDHGRVAGHDVAEWSFNSRLDNVQAAVLSLKLARFDEAIARRRTVARLYHERLVEAFADREGFVLPPPPADDGDHFDVYQNYEIEVGPGRDELKAFLAERGIGTIVQWGGKAIHQFEALGFSDVHLPVTERVMAHSLLLPMNTFVSDDDVHYVADQILAWMEGR